MIASVGALLPAALASALTPGTAMAASSGWTIVPSPNPASSAQLSAVSCASDGTCMAVGYRSLGDTAQTLAEFFNGTPLGDLEDSEHDRQRPRQWRVLRTPQAVHRGRLLDQFTVGGPDARRELERTRLVDRGPTRDGWNGSEHRFRRGVVPRAHVVHSRGQLHGTGLSTESQPLAEHWNGTA